MSKRRRVLLIAYHYPPCAISSGVQRTLALSIHLPKFGWDPVVLTANNAAYERTSSALLDDIPNSVPVARGLALDAARHLSLNGRYWSRLALPDRWKTWWLTAVPIALRLIHRHGISAIWSTYPIATAHVVAGTLTGATRVPWVADFRDPMVETVLQTGEVHPRDPTLRRARLSIEARTVAKAARLVFCTDSARTIVAERYASIDATQLAVIPNGFEEAAFQAAERLPHGGGSPRRLLLHSGTIYPGADRDPTALMNALQSLRRDGLISPENFELRLRDPSNEQYFIQLAERFDLSDIVTVFGPLPYKEALAEMLSADGLLLLQGYTSNPAIPAKLYEYIRARRPILGLVHPDGESFSLLRRLGVTTIATLDDFASINGVIRLWIEEGDSRFLPFVDEMAAFSREESTAKLARILDQVCLN